MNEQDIKLLLMLASTQNITQAASKLFVTQSALSKRIYAIESELNIQLMLRSRHGIQFTPEGQVVLAYCRDIYGQFQAMRNELASLSNEVFGEIRLGVSINYSLYRLPKVLKYFRERYPAVVTHIHTEHSRYLIHKLLLGELDMAIVRGNFNWSGPKFCLSEEPMYVIKPNEEWVVTGETYIARRTDSQFEHMIAKWLQENSIEVLGQTVLVDNIGTCVEMVKQGLGWAIVPEICLDTFSGYKKAIVFADGQAFTRSTYVLLNERSKNLKPVTTLIDVLRG